MDEVADRRRIELTLMDEVADCRRSTPARTADTADRRTTEPTRTPDGADRRPTDLARMEAAAIEAGRWLRRTGRVSLPVRARPRAVTTD